ncbi:hypothetical protein LY78DRAFT_16846 [Colletotrichum sublineola]|nr:hypothetical protein LY78DRAFT_16846 [Colletotrichum sublineola]
MDVFALPGKLRCRALCHNRRGVSFTCIIGSPQGRLVVVRCQPSREPAVAPRSDGASDSLLVAACFSCRGIFSYVINSLSLWPYATPIGIGCKLLSYKSGIGSINRGRPFHALLGRSRRRRQAAFCRGTSQQAVSRICPMALRTHLPPNGTGRTRWLQGLGASKDVCR